MMMTAQRLKRSLLAVIAVLTLVMVAPSAKAAVTLE